MFGIKKFFLGLIIGLLAGLWAGVNISYDQPIWSNPFEAPALTEKGVAADAKQGTKKATRDSIDD